MRGKGILEAEKGTRQKLEPLMFQKSYQPCGPRGQQPRGGWLGS